MVSPGSFVPLFEGNGLIGVVDNFVWEETARQVAAWRDRYGFTLPVSVNLSRADVSDPTLVDRLAALIERNDLDFKSIKLEVTESAYVETKGQLDFLREGGCDLVQGYYFSRPLPPEEFAHLIENELAIRRGETT